jgi:hypothetical protein
MQKESAEPVSAGILRMQPGNADGISGQMPEVFGIASHRKFEYSPRQLLEMHAKGATISLVATSLGEDLLDILP